MPLSLHVIIVSVVMVFGILLWNLDYRIKVDTIHLTKLSFLLCNY